MAHQFPPDVEEQLRERMASGQYESEVDVLRDALRALKRQNNDMAAIREAISDMEAGDRGRPFEDFVAEFRNKYNIRQDA
jgi:putative addiction module CopG family antidote